MDRDAHPPAGPLTAAALSTATRHADPVRAVAVVGGGWAGLACAWRLTEAGHRVTLFEMAAELGGRARGVDIAGHRLDNGQHILVGAYVRTLALMRSVGVDPAAVLWRDSLDLRDAHGNGLRLPRGTALPALLRAVHDARGWCTRDRASLLAHAAAWFVRGFRCAPRTTVADLCRRMPATLRSSLIDPLCVAALNTPPETASATVFLRVLRDTLFGGTRAADLLLPRRSLDDLLPGPARRALQSAGAVLRCGHRVQGIERLPRATSPAGWAVDGIAFEEVVLACTAGEAARLTAGFAPDWSRAAGALQHAPIVTVYLHVDGARLPAPLVALPTQPGAAAALDTGPAQFAFDHGAIGGAPGVLAFVVSAASGSVEAGREATAAAVMRQAARELPAGCLRAAPQVLQVLAERRATFLCTPGLERPSLAIAPGLWAAGDYVDGPYPATLEAAVRSGEAAAEAVTAARLASHNAKIPA